MCLTGQTVRCSFWLGMSLLGLLTASPIQAQFRGGVPSPEEAFQRTDKNGNGQIDREEIESLPGFIREAYTRQGIDGSRPVSKNEFIDLSNKFRDEMRSRFERGDFGRLPGGPGFGGGPPPSFSEERRPDTPRPEEPEDRDSHRDDRRRDERREDDSRDHRSNSSASKSKKIGKPKVRITKELPDEYRERDKNGDGQIALYEWDRKAFARFQELDLNADGFLTPSELLSPASKKNSDNGKSTIAATAGKSSERTSSSGGSKGDKPSTKESRADGKNSSSEKTNSSDKSPSAADTPGDTAFRALDVNNDGQLDADEWDRARGARKRFEKAGVTVSLPIKQSQFVELYSKAN